MTYFVFFLYFHIATALDNVDISRKKKTDREKSMRKWENEVNKITKDERK
jgi:hypothetical protein